jgi:hypothetical protein
LEFAPPVADDADCSLCAEDTHIRVPRVDEWSPSDISQSYQWWPSTGIHDPSLEIRCPSPVDLTVNAFHYHEEGSVTLLH